MNLANFPTAAPRIGLSRGQLEIVTLAMAARERECAELAEHIDRQRTSLAELRGLLLRTSWRRRSR